MKEETKKKKLNLVKSATSFKINIPSDVETKIRHLCSIVHDVEWSGTLFYKHSGSFEDGTFEVTCVDIFVMDIGSSGYTEYDESADIVTYRVDHDLLDSDIQEGLIHSHNNMSTFFSSTDRDTLLEEGTNTNHFVSLIVNNEGTYTAGVTRRIVNKTKATGHMRYVDNTYYNTYNGEQVLLDDNTVTEEDVDWENENEAVEWFELEINKEEAETSFKEIDDRLKEIRKIKSAKTKRKDFYSPKADFPKTQYYNWGKYENDFYDDYPPYHYQESLYSDWGKGEKKSTPKSTPKEQSLFPEVKKEKYVKKEDYSALEIEDIPICLIESFNPEIVEEIAIKLLSSCAIVSYKTFNIKEWTKKMDSVYKAHFGSIEDNKKLEEWFELMLEFYVYTEDKALLNRLNATSAVKYNTSDTAEILAYNLYEYMDTLPKSEIKDVIMNLLTTYIPDDVFNLT